MGEVKKKIIKPLSDYEETLIWMSYRYAIGRHTIASCTHAGDIAKHSYERLLLNKNRMQFMSKDINEEIGRCLEWQPFHFTINRYSGFEEHEISPLNFFYMFINSINIKDFSELNKYKTIEVVKDGDSIKFNTVLKESDEKSYISSMDIDDLEPWQKLASVFNLKSHKFCKTNFNNEEKIIEYIDNWVRITDEFIKYELRKMPIDSYLNNSVITCSINEDYIVEDNLKN